MNAIKEKTLSKDSLINLLQGRLNWAESHLQSMSTESLNYIYKNILNGNLVTKAKANTSYNLIQFMIPAKVMEYLSLSYGDYFDVKVNLNSKEVILHKGKRNKIKVKQRNMVYLPYMLSEKKILKGNDDTLIIVKDGNITLKSFSYLQ